MSIQWNGHDSGLAPGMAERITQVVDPLPYLYVVSFGFRSIAEQNALYARGRDANGTVVDRASVVTNAKGGQSAHNYGLAVDLYPVINGSLDYGYANGMPEPSSAAFPAWQALWDAVYADPYLHSGKDFPGLYDPGHVERLNWKLFTNQPVPSDVTSVDQSGADQSGGGTSDLSNPSGMTPTSVLLVLGGLAVAALLYLRGRS